MEKSRPSDQVVLFIDQHNPKPSSMEAENHQEKPRHPIKVKTLNRLSFSKPKSRIQEFNHVPRNKLAASEEEDDIIQPTYKLTSNEEDDDEDDWKWDKEDMEEDGSEHNTKLHQKKKFKVKWRLVMEWALFLNILACLVCSLTISSITNMHVLGLEIWRWCVMVMVTFSGRLVSGWLVGVIVFFLERNFMLRDKVLYFIYGLRKSIRNCLWLGLVLLSYWSLVFDDVQKKNHKFLNKMFQALVAVLVGATIWLVKIVLVKMLASSFHVTTYFDRMKESVFHHYILDTLSGPAMEDAEEILRQHQLMGSKSMPARLKMKEAKNSYKSKRFGSRKIDMEKLRELSMESPSSAWSVKRLVNYVRSSGLSTISRTVDDFGNAESEINSEWEARNCAQRIFKNVAKPGAKYIEEEDLMRFLKRVEIHTIFPLFEGALETGQISRSSFRNWVIRAYYERKALAQSLNDTKTAVQQLHKIASAIVSVIIIIVMLLVMEVATLKIILFCITQTVLIGVAFQGTCKTVLEAIIFVFVMHPFDIGDRCVIDGVHMIVEEMNILTTVFLRYDNEKIYYPNAVLLSKPISNFYRSPEMGDAVDFTIDVSTSMETILALKKSIQMYIESKPKYWNPKYSLIAKGIENVDKLKFALCVQHTINHQNYGERNVRMTELLLELKRIFEIHGVKYHLLPQEIQITHMNIEHGKVLFQS
ncbi:mechanosensitive ion channel protein 10-like [Vigna unguiculata]|uniref:Mechanosensitive ion channel protein n=1 Tax=Vigna unguiculata TaxID=3917 RepID=A0A4D6KZ93_VIGUN|nr:mechanosensitive ion channel protein 10-like [Vigna unguiculata]QCD81847.1 small conductance mechanosensitive channel [Vigna unguiculata]